MSSFPFRASSYLACLVPPALLATGIQAHAKLFRRLREEVWKAVSWKLAANSRCAAFSRSADSTQREMLCSRGGSQIRSPWPAAPFRSA